ncbi:MAG: alpha/beta fold hydrolase [Desulfovibrio sp.]|nr:alpha/beta fold hydrolase [Desulfovibrio sp.]
MPLLSSCYRCPPGFASAKVSTIFPVLFRKVDYPPKAQGGDSRILRERIETPDGDFLDLDRYPGPANPRFACVLTHGLAGNARRKYIRGLARAIAGAGGLPLAWNRRGCSGEMNRTARFSCMLETEDLALVVRHAEALDLPLVLAGFSMGANQTLKYLARRDVSPLIRAGIAISDPCDPATASAYIDAPENAVFRNYLLRGLVPGVKAKLADFPGIASGCDMDRVTTFLEFDNAVTAPMFGFKSAMDYYLAANATREIPFIRHPVYLLNAMDDPFCSPACHPFEQALKSPCFWFEAPRHGGHVGFVTLKADYYHELRAVRFIQERSGIFG